MLFSPQDPSFDASSPHHCTVSIASLADMGAWAHRVAGLLQSGDVICLGGDLGAGKTTFSRFLVGALGLLDPVSSPTFTLVHEYRSGGAFPVYHMDAYRLRGEREAEDSGLIDYLTQTDGVTLVEWPERLALLLPANRLELFLSHADETNGANEEARTVTVTARGARWETVLQEGELC